MNTELRKKMVEDMQLHGYAERTQKLGHGVGPPNPPRRWVAFGGRWTDEAWATTAEGFWWHHFGFPAVEYAMIGRAEAHEKQGELRFGSKHMPAGQKAVF